MKNDEILQKLDEASKLGLSVCRDAAAVIRTQSEMIERLEWRCAESRADKLAAAYTELRKSVLRVRETASELKHWGLEDSVVDIEDVSDRLEEQLDEVVAGAHPDAIGEGIVAAASRLPSVESDLRSAVNLIGEASGIGASALMAAGIYCTRFDWVTGDVLMDRVSIAGIPSGKMELAAQGSTALGYLHSLHEKLRGKAS